MTSTSWGGLLLIWLDRAKCKVKLWAQWQHWDQSTSAKVLENILPSIWTYQQAILWRFFQFAHHCGNQQWNCELPRKTGSKPPGTKCKGMWPLSYSLISLHFCRALKVIDMNLNIKWETFAFNVKMWAQPPQLSLLSLSGGGRCEKIFLLSQKVHIAISEMVSFWHCMGFTL
jgi:hypothetical protein